MLSIIIPVYNERNNLPLLIGELRKLLEKMPNTEIIFIDDGSDDDSFVELVQASRTDNRFKIIRFAVNAGQTAAIQAGIDYASGDILVFMDSDLQNDPQDIPRLLEMLDKGYDVVSGWRIDRKDNPLKRNLPSHVANAIISSVFGIRLHDYGCTLKAYRRKMLKNVNLYGEMHRFIPVYASWQGAKIGEIPVGHRVRKYGKSKYGLERVFKVLLDILVVKFLNKYLTKPIYVFGGFGLAAYFFAIMSFLWALYLKYFCNTSLIETPLPLFSAICVILGCMSILMGFLGEIVIRVYFESTRRRAYLIRETVNLQTPTSFQNV